MKDEEKEMAKYKVNYQGGESRYSNAAIDYMIVEVPDPENEGEMIELYAEMEIPRGTKRRKFSRMTATHTTTSRRKSSAKREKTASIPKFWFFTMTMTGHKPQEAGMRYQDFHRLLETAEKTSRREALDFAIGGCGIADEADAKSGRPDLGDEIRAPQHEAYPQSYAAQSKEICGEVRYPAALDRAVGGRKAQPAEVPVQAACMGGFLRSLRH